MGSRLFFVSIQNGIMLSVCLWKQMKFQSEERNNTKWNWYPSNQYVYWTFSNEPWLFFNNPVWTSKQIICWTLIFSVGVYKSNSQRHFIHDIVSPYYSVFSADFEREQILSHPVLFWSIIDYRFFFISKNYFNEHSKKIYNPSKLDFETFLWK